MRRPTPGKTDATGRGRRALYLLVALVAVFLVSIVAMRQNRRDPEEVFRKNGTLKIEVLNGCAVDRLALKTTDVLRESGFNVVKIGNAGGEFYKETVVIERNSDKGENARYVARQIGCRNIGQDIDRALYIDVTIIVGEDYLKIFPDVEKKL